ncbi:MAG: hypothetical protein HYT12_04035 [Candidatus Liptonbacteria bacterium]|nr:hypothetical protein [Candidatus Liptonbacteria bacterium]
MRDSILNFPKQFEWNPKIENSDKFVAREKFIHAGMGGSQLAGDILKILRPDMNFISHRGYGLPKLKDSDLQERVLVANSYSGNTEETIDALMEALNKGLMTMVIATGGKLLEIAVERQIPYIKLPSLGIQPRMATGVGIRALFRTIGDELMLQESSNLASELNPLKYEKHGKELAGKIKGRIPIIYASDDNSAIARNWKIKFNETGKVPAFWNVLPELNHNEMTGFSAFIDGISEEAKNLSDKFYFIFLKDGNDHPRIAARFNVLEKLFTEKGMPVTTVELEGANKLRKIFSSLILADWATLYNAEQYGLDPEEVPLVEEFKKLIATQ